MSADLSPTARALLAFESIQDRPGITGAELAARLGVTDRAARRYVGILREAGIPVESLSGPYGGYRVGRGARLAPLMFSTPEALGLVMAVLQGWHGAADGDHPVAAALGKIVRVLPASSAAPVEAMRRVSAQNPGDAAASPDPQLTATVAQACESRQQLKLVYRTRDMVVDPWAVVVRHGRWYLLCWSHSARARRVLRIDRVAHASPTGASFTVPADLDPVRDVEQHLADGWTYQVEVRIEAPIDVASHWVSRSLGRLHPDSDDTCLLHGTTDNPEWYAAQLAATQLPFFVLAGDEVRAQVQALAARLARAAAR
ncbi:WYL domain-containing protein [Allokutzneria sp. A3M-2-11 16]|uniref:helix-turn-helix transcriptional regulator n=1 Tax=Allokutzneria sp. A3M-2-11 16 TaxID=2962043 RepID=UPI0020B8250E|nr:WYL domain-containing protein [Allokutzneria sp. A3M-2-11 16]MCP3805532.1 WYL domain-containing protein [Allokutzneria sp. A3M-2-11 16]